MLESQPHPLREMVDPSLLNILNKDDNVVLMNMTSMLPNMDDNVVLMNMTSMLPNMVWLCKEDTLHLDECYGLTLL